MGRGRVPNGKALALAGHLALSVVMLAACVHRAAAATQAACPEPTKEDIAASPPGDNPKTWICEANSKKPISGALHWMRDSAEYAAVTKTIFAEAAHAAERASRKYGRWGFIVILDADDTLLSTTAYQKEREICGLPYSDASWCRWVNSEDIRTVPGAAEFVARVHALHGLIAVVTNRDASQQWVTRENLKKAGIIYDAFRAMQKNTDKAPRWKGVTGELAEVARKLGRKGKPPRPVIWVGDQISDLPLLDAGGNILGSRNESDKGEGLGDGLYLLPNPEYGNWQKKVPE